MKYLRQMRTICNILLILSIIIGLLFASSVYMKSDSNNRFYPPVNMSTRQSDILKGFGCWRVNYDTCYKSNVCVTRNAVIAVYPNGALGDVLFVRKY